MVETNFKHTEIGLIPHDWEVKTLGELFIFNAGGDVQKDCYSPVKIGDKTNPIYSNSLENKGLYGYTSNPRYTANAITITGRGSLGHAEYRNHAFDAIVRLLVLNPIRDTIDCSFVTNEINFLVPFVFESTGVPQLTVPQAQSAIISLPPTLAEQERIAGALSSIDTLIGALNEQIEKKRHIKQGTMQQLLTGKKRLAGFTGEWKSVRLGDVTKLKSGYAFKSTTYSNIGKFKIITITNVQNGVLDMSDYNKIAEIPSNIQEHQILKEGDILISMTGNVGRVCRVDCKNCLLNQRVGVFALKNTIDAEYLYVILNNLEFEKEMIGKGHGAAQPNIGSSDVESYCFTIPPTIAEQSAIAAVLSGMDTEIVALEQKRDKYIAIKSGMMQDLLTGKIRLV